MKVSAALVLLAAAAHAAALPGFRVQRLGSTNGFADSIAIDSHDTIYYTTTDGSLFRFSNGASQLVTRVNTNAVGDSGLLGMALLDDQTAVVHYTNATMTADVVSTIDLANGMQTVLHSFTCDITMPDRPCPTEHHGGNPSVGADGSIFVGIGDYGGFLDAALPEWNGGKIFRITSAGSVQQFASGFRNPFDTAWDASSQQLIVPDNGDVSDDEINIVHLGDFCGWPYTMGNQPPVDGAVPPIYTFPSVVVPTGLAALNGHNAYFPGGYLLATFVAQALDYIPDISARPLPDPIPVIAGLTPSIIDVAQGPAGEIDFVTAEGIYELIPPLRGDCNGDGLVTIADIAALAQELLDGNPEPATSAQAGAFNGSWGCDVNADGIIDSRDMSALLALLSVRTRAVRP
ncbi:MAG TPA: PQQ-dependent sugar dehydrogenase [Thermoanaerobaculia bacterium]|nr:PQQ-dependent sugar dehydrogenase [Thermoanaerobaculia bacterium]